MLQEFRVYALNATLKNWQEDINFFKNNLHKLANIGEYVDLYSDSNVKKEFEDKVKKNPKIGQKINDQSDEFNN